MHHPITTLPLALVLAATVAGCGGEPQTSDFSAHYRIIFPEGEAEGLAQAFYRESRGPLPDAEGVALSLRGSAMTLLTNEESENRTWIFDGRTPRLEPDATYEFVLEIPGLEPVQHTIAMVHPGELTGPAAGTEISLYEDLTVTWSEAVPGETDLIAFRLRDGDRHYFSGFSDWQVIAMGAGEQATEGLMTRASDGLASVSVRADAIRRSYEGAVASRDGVGQPVEPGAPPLAVELVLARSRSGPSSPPFQGGTISLLAEVSSIPVVLVP